MLKLWTVSWGVGALDVGLKNAGGLCRRCVSVAMVTDGFGFNFLGEFDILFCFFFFFSVFALKWHLVFVWWVGCGSYFFCLCLEAGR